MTSASRRLARFFSIWRASGRAQLALQAARGRCQDVVLEFVRAGGRVDAKAVAYRGIELPRRLFAGRDLAGTGYVRRLGDSGARIESSDGVFTTTLAGGERFESDATHLLGSLGMLVERFLDEEYRWLEVEGAVVVDVGTNIGDSVVYFAGRGAAHVYGFEPDAVAFEAAERNLMLNGVRNATVQLVAVGQADSPDEGETGFAGVLRRAAASHPGLPIVCKIDCEGCEYGILGGAAPQPETMATVRQMIIEYHWRSPSPLVESLEALGFKVETSPAAAPGIGWVRAWRPAGKRDG